MKARLGALSLLLLVSGCVDNQYPYSSGYSNQSSGYRGCEYYGNCPYRDDYRHDRDRYRDDDRYRDHDRYDRDRYDDRDRDRDRDRHDRDDYQRKPPERVTPPPAPAPKPAEPVVRPNCPAGTQYTGRTCKIVDQKLRRPGGDGNINPCPSGMWVSGDKCVGKQIIVR